MLTTPEQPRLLQVGDVIHHHYGAGIKSMTVTRVTAKRAYVGDAYTFNREVRKDNEVREIGGGTGRWSREWYSLATPEAIAKVAAAKALSDRRNKVSSALRALEVRAWEMPADQCTALLEALAPFLPA